mmetsp:Transcript_2973/g.4167  ORF Transcript_2973/g.4167 Transcript_2973/m.4167 type:complete len:223 (-) Transcript_2973:3660-4328(-)|eukprot:CAMPEP_0184861136 /NCGR_PEP_ID=MMETSP0580-20130426/5895_1 /TAXON_ID=1118495 /ORGANISM="Dactyliosolen fragilissimus" /LENGTH=222 /DNA_ID=CAMNT_0027358527 /DNA_START=1092 /DNA_END=1760 /DNA_ORIENTATION=-
MDTSGGESSLLSLCSLSSSDLGGTVCGGHIGTSKRMCVNKICSIMKHQSVKASIPSERCLFIPAPGRDNNQQMVYLKPYVSSLEINEDRYIKLMTERRSVDQWELLFGIMRDGKKEDFLAAMKMVKQETELGKTPRKKRMKFLFTPSTYEADLSSTMVLPVEELGPEEVALTALTKQWLALIEYVKSVKVLCDSVQLSLEKSLTEIKDEFSDVDLTTFHLKQ